MRTSHRIVMVLALVTSGIVGTDTNAQAAPTMESGPRAIAKHCAAMARSQSQKMSEILGYASICMAQSGLTLDQIDQGRAETLHVRPLTKRANGSIRPMTTNSGDVTPTAPSIEVCAPIDCGENVWFIDSWWDFSNQSMNDLVDDQDYLCSNPCNIGGYDGFGMAFNRSVPSVESYLTWTFGNTSYYPTSLGRMQPSDANSTGVSYTGQDKLHADFPNGTNGPPAYDYNFMHGWQEIQINDIGCGSFQAFSKYAHTWSDTTFNGFGLGPWSLSVQWTAGNHGWERSSQPSPTYTLC